MSHESPVTAALADIQRKARSEALASVRVHIVTVAQGYDEKARRGDAVAAVKAQTLRDLLEGIEK